MLFGSTLKRNRKPRIGTSFAAAWLFAACLLASWPVAAASYEEGLAAFDKRNYAVALQEWLPLAEAGDARAQHGMGLLAEIGVPKRDYTAAAIWYKKAADQGLPAALTNLGILYAEGRGVEKNAAESAALWKTAADAGHPVAQFNLALLYYRGDGGLEQNFNDAAWWFAQSAAQGSPDAQYALAELYRAGRGVPRNLSEAKRWYEQAASNGYPQARERLTSLDLEMQNQTLAPSGIADAPDAAPAETATPPAATTTASTATTTPASSTTTPAAATTAASTAPAPDAGDVFNPTPKPFVPSAEALAAGQGTAQPVPDAQPLPAPEPQPAPETGDAAPAPEPMIASPGTAAVPQSEPASVAPAPQPVPDAATPDAETTASAPAAEPSAEIIAAAPAPEPAPLDQPDAAAIGPTPQPLAPTAAAPAAEATDAEPAETLDQASDGAIRVWLSSAKTESGAATYWQNLQQAFPDLLGSLQPTIKRVDLGGDLGVWFRVLGGPLQSRASADELCRELIARAPQESCMVVLN